MIRPGLPHGTTVPTSDKKVTVSEGRYFASQARRGRLGEKRRTAPYSRSGLGRPNREYGGPTVLVAGGATYEPTPRCPAQERHPSGPAHLEYGASAVFPCGRRRREMVRPGLPHSTTKSRVRRRPPFWLRREAACDAHARSPAHERRSPPSFAPRFEPRVTPLASSGVDPALPRRGYFTQPGVATSGGYPGRFGPEERQS